MAHLRQHIAGETLPDRPPSRLHHFCMFWVEMLYVMKQSNPIQSNPIQSNPIQSNPIQSNPIQSNPIQCNAMQCNAMQCNAMHCIVQCNAMQCIALHCIALHCIALHCIALHCIALHCAMQCNAMQCNAMQCNAMQCNAMQCNAMQCNAMQCNAIHSVNRFRLFHFKILPIEGGKQGGFNTSEGHVWSLSHEEQWSRGRAPDCQSMGRWFNPTNRGFETQAISFTPHLSVSFGRDTKSRWSLLSGVYARGSKRFDTGGKCVTCSGLTNSRALAQVWAVWNKPPKMC